MSFPKKEMHVENKVKSLVLENIKDLAQKAWYFPSDENLAELLNAVEYLKKILKAD